MAGPRGATNAKAKRVKKGKGKKISKRIAGPEFNSSSSGSEAEEDDVLEEEEEEVQGPGPVQQFLTRQEKKAAMMAAMKAELAGGKQGDAEEAEEEEEEEEEQEEQEEEEVDEAEEEEVEEGDGETKKAGMAEAIARVLGRTVATPILAFDKSKDAEIDKEKLERKEQREKRLEKRKRLERGHVSLAEGDLNHERILRKLATRGVVLLFNAVNKQQKELDKVTSKAPEFQKDKGTNFYDNNSRLETNSFLVLKMSKDNFLDLIKTGSAKVATAAPAATKSASGPLSASATAAPWNVFTDDYLMGPNSLKGWDRPTNAQADSFDDSTAAAVAREDLMDS